MPLVPFRFVPVKNLDVHAMRQIFAGEETEGALLVDATNAFDSINRQAGLHNISIMCPPLAQVLFNTYQAPVRCLTQGGGEISSSEGTTQGDRLAIRPLIDCLQSLCPTVKREPPLGPESTLSNMLVIK